MEEIQHLCRFMIQVNRRKTVVNGTKTKRGESEEEKKASDIVELRVERTPWLLLVQALVCARVVLSREVSTNYGITINYLCEWIREK
jgi:hypothetical protein